MLQVLVFSPLKHYFSKCFNICSFKVLFHISGLYSVVAQHEEGVRGAGEDMQEMEWCWEVTWTTVTLTCSYSACFPLIHLYFGNFTPDFEQHGPVPLRSSRLCDNYFQRKCMLLFNLKRRQMTTEQQSSLRFCSILFKSCGISNSHVGSMDCGS